MPIARFAIALQFAKTARSDTGMTTATARSVSTPTALCVNQTTDQSAPSASPRMYQMQMASAS